ncbi:MAG: (d)CMP kinase [Dehalococcoidia bacterium]
MDGPSASGKSAAGSRVAARLGYPFVDTGAMYRAVTWLALQRGTDIADGDGLTALAESAVLQIGPPPADRREMCSISVEGRDVTPFLRDAAVEQAVSHVSAMPGVRRALVRIQREASPADVVMAGRDIGTVVLPDATLKVFLIASIEVRAVRRQEELAQKGRVETAAQVRAGLEQRDRIDSGREVSPLKPAEDAVMIDSDPLTLDQVVEEIVALARERGAVEVEPAR